MCGENITVKHSQHFRYGSPPRVRGKPVECLRSRVDERITPACAGKTATEASINLPRSDHPRVCGENERLCGRAAKFGGSPPRVRGKQIASRVEDNTSRITPACAGKTYTDAAVLCDYADHPRVCGENSVNYQLRHDKNGSPPRVRGKLSSSSASASRCGSPPRVRGKLSPRFQLICDTRITPACAGKT